MFVFLFFFASLVSLLIFFFPIRARSLSSLPRVRLLTPNTLDAVTLSQGETHEKFEEADAFVYIYIYMYVRVLYLFTFCLLFLCALREEKPKRRLKYTTRANYYII